MTLNRRIMITGVSGLLGNNLAFKYRTGNQVFGLYNTHPVFIPDVEMYEVNLLDYPKTRALISKLHPDIVIHCASRTDVDMIETNKEEAWQANVLTTRVLLDSIRDKECKFIYISTDSVYSGRRGPYDEDMETNPCNWYGKTKFESEGFVCDRSGSLVLRTNLYGWNIQDKLSIAEWFLSRLKTGQPTTGFCDVCFSSIYTFLLAEILEKCIERDLIGIYNCACRNAWSKNEFGLRIAELFGLDPSVILSGSIDNAGLMAKRGKDLSLNVKRLEAALGENLPTMSQSLSCLFEDWKKGLPKEIKRLSQGQLSTAFFPPREVITYGGQAIDQADIDVVVKVLKSPYLTQGTEINCFEEELASFVSARYGIAVSSATAALHVACLGCAMGTEHEGITSPVTFLASANCFAYCGGRPLFADIDFRTYNMSPAELKRRITEKTRVIIPVHFAGQSCDMKAVKEVVAQRERAFGHKIYIIEDASHALGSYYRDKRVGCCRYSDAAIFSFHPVKHITTGEGGMVVTNDPGLADRIRTFRSHGITKDRKTFINRELTHASHNFSGVSLPPPLPWYYEQQYLGYNYRLTDIQCALGRSQLKKLSWFQKRRRAIVERYNSAFGAFDNLTVPFESPECESNFHLYVLKIDFEAIGVSRQGLMNRLKDKGIQTQVHYIPVHLQPYYQQQFGTNTGDCPEAEKYYSQCLSLPLFPAMTDMDIDHVIEELKKGLRYV